MRHDHSPFQCGLLFGLIIVICGCNIEYSPWQANPPAEGLTSKHLEWLMESDTGTFAPFKIAVAGDSQMVVGGLREVVDVLNNRDDIAFLVIVGDLTDLGLRREFIWINDTIKKCNCPVLTVVGNHDGLNNGPEIYTELFGPFNYSFTYRGIHFIMWNNNYYEWGEPDFNWLREEVESHDRNVIVAHQPPYAGTLLPEHEAEWKTIRENPRVIATIHGHVHHFDFYLEDGRLPIYTVDRVDGCHYGIIEFTPEGVAFYNCEDSECVKATE